MSDVVSDCCPYCNTRQIGAPDEDDFYRCHDCNFFVRKDWLVADGTGYHLDDSRSVLCPWCGYPAGVAQDLPAEGVAMCGGCSGSLSADMLVTQRELVVDRNKGAKERNVYLALMMGVLLLLVVLGMLMAI